MSFLHIFDLMFPLIIIILAGYLLSFIRKADTKIFSDLIIYITSPALFIVSLTKSDFNVRELFLILLACLFVILGGALVVKLLRKKFDIPLGMYLPIAFMNTGFVGLPLVLMAYGMQGLAYAIIYDVINGLLIFSLGIYIMSEKKDRWEIFKIPVLYVTILGILLNFLNVTLPNFIETPLSILGSITVPMALMLLGYQLGRIKIKSFAMPFYGTVIRAAVGIILPIIFIEIFNVKGLLANVLIIMSALPCATMGIVLSEKYRKKDSEVVASTIAVSIVLSIIYLPILMFFLK